MMFSLNLNPLSEVVPVDPSCKDVPSVEPTRALYTKKMTIRLSI